MGPDIPLPREIEGFEAPFPFDIRELGATERREDGTYLSTRRCWFRTREPLPDDPAVHACLLAYFSDMTGAAFRPLSLGTWGTHTDASLDHAVWFHRPWRADAWSIFDLQTLVNAGGRATIRATMHGEDGSLHLSMAQELLIRELDEPLTFEAPPWVNRDAWDRRPTMGLLDGRAAVVTGGGSGIGRATCRRMAEEGARVAVLDVDGESAEAVADEIGGIAFGVDVGDPDALRAAVDAAAAALGGLSIIYNNAGTSAFNRLHELDPAEWERVLRVNLTGVWAGIRAAVPHLLPGGGGSIVSTASISGTRPAAGEGPYAASKAAVAALTASAALEYAPVHPGQRGVAGHDPHRHDGAAGSSSCPTRWSASRRGRPSAGSASPRTSPTSSSSCAPTWPASSPARTSWSTAG